ncbi:MAG: CvpA family protein [Pseudomonadota bacterium]
MTIVDMVILAALLISVIVGFFRGFVKEAISTVSLIVAVWAAFQFAPAGGSFLESVTGFTALQESEALKMWLGRALIFALVLALGGLAGFGVSYLIDRSGLGGTDRVLGMGFGFCRGALLLGVFALAASYLGFAEDKWWQNSTFVPYAERVGDGIRVLTPRALEYLKPPADDAAPEPQATNGA